MGCRICGGFSCTECFHSIEQQDRYEELVEKYGEKGVHQTLSYYESLEEQTDED